MEIKQALATLVQGEHLPKAAMQQLMHQIMSGQATDAQIGALLMALRIKGETVEEIAAAASVMRELATPVRLSTTEHLVDIVGTGGDGANLFNVSSACAFVVAAAGAKVAKHGNRSVSSSSGSADLLEAAGISLELSPEEITRCIQEVGVGFMFAPQHHAAMKYAIGPRREMGLRTLFNLLGPLTNPAGVTRYLMGVYDAALCRPMAEALQALGAERAMVVHSKDGLDEISLSDQTFVAELNQGSVQEYTLTADDVGIQPQPLNGLQVASSSDSLAMIQAAFAGQNPKAASIIALNAGAALYVAQISDTLEGGVSLAQQVLDGGQAAEKMEELAVFTQRLKREK